MSDQKLISFLIVSNNYENLGKSLKSWGKETKELYASPPWTQDKPIAAVCYIKNKGRWNLSGNIEIKTPWVICLEEDEFLEPANLSKLLAYLKDATPSVVKIRVERIIPHDELKKYAWVTTRDLFDKPIKEISSYYTLEERIFPTSLLAKTLVESSSKDNELKQLRCTIFGRDGSVCPPLSQPEIYISRIPVPDPDSSKKIPKDHEIFAHGHEIYFNDTIYCSRFVWPHSVYHTIRMHYIPSIMQGLEQGMGNHLIAFHALVYLIRFKEFEKAYQIVKLIPEEWEKRYPFLLNAMAIACYSLGHSSESLRLFQQIFDLDPTFDTALGNFVRLLILQGKDAEIKSLEQAYAEKNKHPLKDDILEVYKKVRDENEGKTATVSLCVIVRDEAKNLLKALESIRKSVDEIIVVDTGSSDDSIKIAKDFGARVFSLPWEDDFSEARNFALEKATSDYILVLDGDEYLSPFHILDIQVLKSILPLKNLAAYELSIGHYLNDTDWLFLAREKGNFKEETKRIKIFPRLEEIKYRGVVNECVRTALQEKDIPIFHIPSESLHILHNREGRMERIKRKCYLYDKVHSPDKELILMAIKDFSLLGDTDKTLCWLHKFHGYEGLDDQSSIRMGVHIAKLMESREPDQARQFYLQMLKTAHHEPSLVIACASFLLRNNQLEDIRDVPFDLSTEWPVGSEKQRLEYLCFASLKYSISGEPDKALDTIMKVLDETPAHLLGQSVRFYLLAFRGDIGGAISALDYLFELSSVAKNIIVDSILDLLDIIQELCEYLQKQGYLAERSFILQGALALHGLLEGK